MRVAKIERRKSYICSEIGVEEVELALRLGNKSPNKIRPLKIVMGNRTLGKVILDNAKNIRSKASKKYMY